MMFRCKLLNDAKNIFVVCQKEKQKHKGVEKIKPRTFKNESAVIHDSFKCFFSHSTHMWVALAWSCLIQGAIIKNKDTISSKTPKRFKKPVLPFNYLNYSMVSSLNAKN